MCQLEGVKNNGTSEKKNNVLISKKMKKPGKFLLELINKHIYVTKIIVQTNIVPKSKSEICVHEKSHNFTQV